MTKIEYLSLLHVANLKNTSNISFFYIVEAFLKHLKRYRHDVKMLLCLEQIQSAICELEKLVYGDNQPGRLYQFRTLYDFYDSCIAKVYDTEEFEKTFGKIESDLGYLNYKLAVDITINADCNVIDAWIENAPSEAVHHENDSSCRSQYEGDE